MKTEQRTVAGARRRLGLQGGACPPHRRRFQTSAHRVAVAREQRRAALRCFSRSSRLAENKMHREPRRTANHSGVRHPSAMHDQGAARGASRKPKFLEHAPEQRAHVTTYHSTRPAVLAPSSCNIPTVAAHRRSLPPPPRPRFWPAASADNRSHRASIASDLPARSSRTLLVTGAAVLCTRNNRRVCAAFVADAVPSLTGRRLRSAQDNSQHDEPLIHRDERRRWRTSAGRAATAPDGDAAAAAELESSRLAQRAAAARARGYDCYNVSLRPFPKGSGGDGAPSLLRALLSLFDHGVNETALVLALYAWSEAMSSKTKPSRSQPASRRRHTRRRTIR